VKENFNKFGYEDADITSILPFKPSMYQFDYDIKVKDNTGNDELIAIIEAKQSDILMGFRQNVLQLTTSHQKKTKCRRIIW
ncbi:6554_t:CDS:2, partial [Gigaspora rosea]